MSKSKSLPSQLRVAPEFSNLGRLASILKPASANPAGRVEPPLATDDQSWTVFGVGAIWQTAAENAARQSGNDLGDWLRQTIDEAAAAQGLPAPATKDA